MKYIVDIDDAVAAVLEDGARKLGYPDVPAVISEMLNLTLPMVKESLDTPEGIEFLKEFIKEAKK